MEAPQYHLQNVVHAKQTLEDFDGPLDVILLLLSKNKIEIQDISISSILEQYLAWLDERKRMDMEVASEFIAMASHLMYIKTRMLLSEAEKAEAESEMEELIASLRQRQRKDAYEQIKIACGALALRNDIGLGMFPKQPEPLRRDQTYRYQHDRQDLLDALAAMQDRSQRRLPPPVSNFAGIVGTEPYPVAKKAAEVLRRLIGHGVMKFLSLFKGSRSRSEIVATFCRCWSFADSIRCALKTRPASRRSPSCRSRTKKTFFWRNRNGTERIAAGADGDFVCCGRAGGSIAAV